MPVHNYNDRVRIVAVEIEENCQAITKKQTRVLCYTLNMSLLLTVLIVVTTSSPDKLMYAFVPKTNGRPNSFKSGTACLSGMVPSSLLSSPLPALLSRPFRQYLLFYPFLTGIRDRYPGQIFEFANTFK
jgi:hypothetical protein